MPWTLYWYILKQILKLLVTATMVLLVVVSFGAAIKPLSDGVIAPGGLPRFIFYTVPTMLEFALPFAGAFASVMVFCRMASDNEIIACSASGLSYRRVLLPVFVLGLGLTMGLFYLSNWVVPRFYHRVAQMLERDVTRLIVTQIRKGQTVDSLENTLLYADTAEETDNPPPIPGSEVQPHRLIRLSGVAMTRMDKLGTVTTDSTAASASILLFNYEGSNWATLRMEDVSIYDSTKQQLLYVREWEVPPISLPSPLRDNPRFLSWPQLNDLARRPDKYDQVRNKKEKLAAARARMDIRQKIEAQLSSLGGSIELLGPLNEQYTVTAPRFETSARHIVMLAMGDQGVKIDQRVHGLIVRKIDARKVVLTIESEDPGEEPRIVLEPKDASVTDMRTTGRGTEHAEMRELRLRWPELVIKPLIRTPLDELVESSEPIIAAGGDRGELVKAAVNDINKEKLKLGRRILAQLNERAASSTGCLLILLLGAMLSLKYRGGTPLVVYFWTFLLSTCVVIINRSGLNFARDPSVNLASGLLVLWSGNLAMIAITLFSYLRLSRH